MKVFWLVGIFQLSYLLHKGTDLSNAISLSIDYFDDDRKSKSLFVFSDGEDHEKTYDQINQKIKDEKIIINTICIGSDKPLSF